MARFSILFILFLCFIGSANAQENRSFTNTPTDLKQTGWNKVLCMKNGNTVLFHMEPTKPVMVKVYDSTHKEIASAKNVCRLLDIYIISSAIFMGIYDINGEAVLFMQQEHLSKSRLIRMRFSATTGQLVAEDVIAEQQSIGKRTVFNIAKNKQEEGYELLISTDVPQFLDCKIAVSFFNKNHTVYKEVPLEVDRKNYDYMSVIGFESQPNGICVSMSLAKLELNGTVHNNGIAANEPDIYGHNLAIFYIPKDGSVALRRMVDVTTDVYPYFSDYTYNAFSKSINFLLFSYRNVQYHYGLEWRPGMLLANLFLKLDENDLSVNHNWIRNKLVNAGLREQTDSTHVFNGIPVQMLTNENGLSTLISQSYERYPLRENFERVDYNTYMSYIGITQFDDDGNEMWGTALPDFQCMRSLHHYYHPDVLGKRWQGQYMFDDLPEQVFERQFVSFNSYFANKDMYIVYDDVKQNFNNSLAHPGDTVVDFSKTNACYYKIDRKKEITKKYLFGESGQDEYRSSLIEGADFDDKRGVYASLVEYRKKDEITLCMAWAHLD